MSYPRFDDARAQFVEFLVSCGQSDDLLWLAREHVAVVARRLFVKVPAENGERFAKEQYAYGVGRRLGVCLSAFACAGRRCCCAVYVPNDEPEAERDLM